jgi:hypothetical protein
MGLTLVITEVSWLCWAAIGFVNLLGVVGALRLVNVAELVVYKRFQQFLRLEFDTRLGMHSPR